MPLLPEVQTSPRSPRTGAWLLPEIIFSPRGARNKVFSSASSSRSDSPRISRRGLALRPAALGVRRRVALPAEVYCASWAPQGSQVVCGGSDGRLTVLGAEASAPRSVVLGGVLLAAKWAPGGGWIAVARRDGDVALVDPVRLGVAARHSFEPGVAVYDVTWSPGRTQFACGGGDRAVTLLDTSAEKKVRHVPVGTVVLSASWSPDRRRIACGGDDGVLRLIDASTGRVECCAPSFRGALYSLEWSPDGETLAIGSDMRKLALFSLRSRAIANEVGFDDWVLSASWSPDGQRVAVGCSDGILAVVDAQRAAVERKFAFVHALHTVAWAPAGEELLAGGMDKALSFVPAAGRD